MRLTNLRWARQLCGAARQVMAAAAALPRAVWVFRGGLMPTAARALRVFRREGLVGLTRRLQMFAGKSVGQARPSGDTVSYARLCTRHHGCRPLVTVIVPNYNHGAFLRQRLDSIYRQTYQHFEVLLLDDCSTDGSRGILEQYAQQYPDRSRLYLNDRNSGGVFHQWKKGLELARGELIWLAESDDYCAPDFLEKLIPNFEIEGVRLAFGASEFVEGDPPRTAWTQSHYLADLGMGGWDRPFIRSAHDLVKRAWVVKNILPNVSAAVFRHPGRLALFDDERWLGLRLCGDWVFYAQLIRGGLVAYEPAAVNYYRQHAANTSVNAQKEAVYYSEHEEVARRLASLYTLDLSDLQRQEDALYRHWCVRHGTDALAAFRKLYDPQRALAAAERRLPNVMMAVYALAAGGGETFPITLANELARKGHGVTLLNCAQAPTESGVRGMIDPQVPLLELARFENLGQICDDMGIEIVHTHHAWSDLTMAMWLHDRPGIKLVVTMHGMYETMPARQVEGLMAALKQRADAFVYTAEKNLRSLPSGFIAEKPVRRIDNALPSRPLRPIDRASLGIRQEDFVLCLVSRALPEKGWAEAIQAVLLANGRSTRRIVLILIGEGPEYERLTRLRPDPDVLVLGFRANVRDYFAMADIGLLPSRFPGESAPLVLIDCLLAGRPMLASDVGEIRYMLETPQGPAGELFPLHDWQIDCHALADVIVALCDDPRRYSRVARRVAAAAEKFRIDTMLKEYEAVYRQVLATPNIPQS